MKFGGKHVLVFFMVTTRMLLIHQVPEGQTINATYYQKVMSFLKINTNICNKIFGYSNAISGFEYSMAIMSIL